MTSVTATQLCWCPLETHLLLFPYVVYLCSWLCCECLHCNYIACIVKLMKMLTSGFFSCSALNSLIHHNFLTELQPFVLSTYKLFSSLPVQNRLQLLFYKVVDRECAIFLILLTKGKAPPHSSHELVHCSGEEEQICKLCFIFQGKPLQG